MKKSRFTDSQIIDVLKRAEAGLAVPELCRELGISAATFYKWRAKFGGMDASPLSQNSCRLDRNRMIRGETNRGTSGSIRTSLQR